MAARAPRIDPRRAAALGQVRQVIGRLVHDGTVVARSDGTVHDLFPVAVGAAEGAALREWVVRERVTRTIEIGLAFVDGDHRFDGVFLDLVYLGRLLRPEPSWSWTTTSCRRSPARCPSASRTSAGGRKWSSDGVGGEG